MTELHDPSKPAGWVPYVDGKPLMNEDGMVIRNDGMLLTPAERNPWYVLMTIAGKPDDLFDETTAKNRRFWNGWACSEMSEDERAALAKKLDLDPTELAPLLSAEQETVRDALRARLATDEIPDPSSRIDLTENPFLQYSCIGEMDFQRNCRFQLLDLQR